MGGEFRVEGLELKVESLGFRYLLFMLKPQALNFQPTKAIPAKNKNHVKELSKNSLEGPGKK